MVGECTHDGEIGKYRHIAHKGVEEQAKGLEIIEIEDAPTCNDYQHAVEVQQGGGQLVLHLEQRVFFEHHYHPEIHTPNDEIPTGAVPHAGEEPHHQDVEGLMLPVASHGDIHIVAEETAQRLVPATPEVGNRITAVGMVEVFLEMETQAAANAYGHI